jgi:anti-anti-sigma regulatory factor
MPNSESPLEPTLAALQDLADLRQQVLDNLPFGIVIYESVTPTTFRFVAANAIVLSGNDITPADVGRMLTDIFSPAQAGQIGANLQSCLANQAPLDVEEYLEFPHRSFWFLSSYRPLPPRPGKPAQVLIVVEDITARKDQDMERARQESLIAQQAAQLAELSTPLLAISEQTVVMPLVGAIDSRRVQQIMETLLSGVADHGASQVILDITGVPIVDTQVANALIHAARAATLLGAKTVLTGIRPEVAQTLVGLGADLSSIVTLGTLEAGIAYAANH